MTAIALVSVIKRYHIIILDTLYVKVLLPIPWTLVDFLPNSKIRTKNWCKKITTFKGGFDADCNRDMNDRHFVPQKYLYLFQDLTFFYPPWTNPKENPSCGFPI